MLASLMRAFVRVGVGVGVVVSVMCGCFFTGPRDAAQVFYGPFAQVHGWALSSVQHRVHCKVPLVEPCGVGGGAAPHRETPVRLRLSLAGTFCE